MKVARSIKLDTSQFADSQTSMGWQNIWALPTTMKSFVICVRGLASAVQLLVPTSPVTPLEYMYLYSQLAEFYELLDCRIPVTSLAKIYKNHITAYFTRLRLHVRQTDTRMPPHVSIITPY